MLQEETPLLVVLMRLSVLADDTRAKDDVAGGSKSPREAKSRSQYSSDIVQSTRTSETVFPARASQIVFRS